MRNGVRDRDDIVEKVCFRHRSCRENFSSVTGKGASELSHKLFVCVTGDDRINESLSNEAGYISVESEPSRVERLGYVSVADGINTSIVFLMRNLFVV